MYIRLILSNLNLLEFFSFFNNFLESQLSISDINIKMTPMQLLFIVVLKISLAS